MRQLPNSFTSYALTPQELKEGSILNVGQIMCIQNQIAQLAEQKLAMKYNPASPMEFLQQEAELQGGLNALRYLLTLSENAQSANNPQEF